MIIFMEKVERVKASGKREVIKTWSRRSMVTPEFVGLTIAVHNGENLFLCLLLKTWWGTA